MSIKYDVSGASVTFSPSVAHHPYYLYEWKIWGGVMGYTTHSTRDVVKPSGYSYYVQLTVYSVFNDD